MGPVLKLAQATQGDLAVKRSQVSGRGLAWHEFDGSCGSGWGRGKLSVAESTARLRDGGTSSVGGRTPAG